ncbi:ankyrin-3-like [Daphnia pulicaria]|uniref:ankyrin-3-like n=1 Tax=Daphnia pulicaria TaxID=35523 RepID=UPI001EEA0039|nr:ankyrin-3-like [Daphnia pulicaria]
MKIIDVLLKNIRDEEINQYKEDTMLLCYAYCNVQHKLGEEIVDRLNQKGIARIQVLQNPKVLDELNAIKQILSNEHGPAAKVANLLKRIEADMAKTYRGQHQPNPHNQSIYDKIREMQARKAEVGSIAHTIGDDSIKTEDKVGQMSQTALRIAIEDSDVEKVRSRFKEFGADFISKATWGEMGTNALHLASFYAKTTDLIEFIRETGKFDINGTDNNGWTPLHYAITGYNAAINARHLIGKRADPTIASNNEGLTPFHTAAIFIREPHILDLFLANDDKFNINHPDQSGITPLHMAIKQSNTATAEFLLSKGANPNIADENGFTPLHVAAKYAKDMDIVNLLLNHIDMNVNYLDNQGNNALHYAMDNEHGLAKEIANLLRGKMAAKSEGSRPNEPKKIATLVPDSIEEDSYIETIRFLMENGQDISALTWGEYEGNALHVASLKAKTTEFIDVVRETGKFDINGVDSDGNTPLHYAILGSNATSARYLLEKRADPTISDNNGITPFHLAAAFSRKTDILGLFLANNKQFDIDHRNQSGMTALHMAIRHSNKVTAEFLLTNGANPNAADRNGLTPLHAAAKYAKDMNIVELLVNHKDVNVNYLDNSGLKALDYTPTNLYGICKQIAKRLREKGEKATSDGINQPESIPARLNAITNSNVKTKHILKENRLDNAAWGENGTNALHVAAAYAKTTDVIDAILETGTFDINGVDNDGDTPLHYAIMGSNSARNAPHLIRLGANPIIANKTKVTPLHLAAKNEETTELIDIILETGQCNINTAEAIVAVNPVDNDGRTPLHYAIKRPDPVTINARRLIKMGADPNIADKNGVTPLHMAARNAESMDLIELLLNTEAVNVNCVDNQGRIPLACARDNKHGLGEKIIARLKESGAKE